MAIYLDNSATTRVCPEAADAALKAMTEVYGNPSSTYTLGRDAKRMLEAGRKSVAEALGCNPVDLYFTSCGSESDNWAIIRGAEYYKKFGTHIISSKVEHDAVLKSLAYLEDEGFTVTYLDPNPDGSISVDSVLNALRDDTILITLMMVNNETGGVTDIAGITKAVRAKQKRILIHTDAVQAFMKVPFRADKLDADMISISGHKIHAPKGIGALYIRHGLNIPPYIMGGRQESGRRAGTEAVPQIAAFGAAAKAASAEFSSYAPRLGAFKAEIIETLSAAVPGFQTVSGTAPHIISLSFPGYKSEVIMNCLEEKEIYVSKSSACKKGGRSHVLTAMGLQDSVIDGTIRVGLSRMTTREDIRQFCKAVIEAVSRLRH